MIPFKQAPLRQHHRPHFKFIEKLHIDPLLMLGLATVIAYGLLILFSAANENFQLVLKQIIRLGIATTVMMIIAQIPPHKLRLLAPWLYFLGLFLLIGVLIMGDIGKGAKRWLDFGVIRFQPSEIMKLAIPMFIAQFLHDKAIPIKTSSLLICSLIMVIPAALVMKQPDLGTALVLIIAGFSIVFFAGIPWRLFLGLAVAFIAAVPILWHYMHDYQKQRVLTFLNPQRDPLGNGYHIIQSKIAIGSGGLFGKGWLLGTQSHLHFLPEHTTDFIFAVCGEEFGFVGILVLLLIYCAIIVRGLIIATRAQDTFSRLLAGSISVTFFFLCFINIGMVCGLLPVVGLPLPLISYGGTSMVTIMAAFGILMSIQTHRQLWTS